MSTHRWLVLLRHASADATRPGQADADRTLSVLGRAEADAAADFLATLPILPPIERLICSPALRTRQTAERVLARMGAIDTRYDSRIYEASPGELLNVLDDHDDVSVATLVGHNPSLEHLVALLSTGRSGAFRGMPPAGLALLRWPVGTPLEPGNVELVTFWSP